MHEQLRFENATIDEFTPDDRPDPVLALHACDTATDDAERVPAGLSPVMRHGVLREQLGVLAPSLPTLCAQEPLAAAGH